MIKMIFSRWNGDVDDDSDNADHDDDHDIFIMVTEDEDDDDLKPEQRSRRIGPAKRAE